MSAKQVLRHSTFAIVASLLLISLAFLILPIFERTVADDAEKSADRHYVLVFSAQAEPNLVRRSHSFAVFVLANDSVAGANGKQIETHCISWMPKSLSIQPFHMLPEPGVNLDMNATLDWARSVHSRVSMWGPFAIQKELYEKAVVREGQLESGIVQYLCMDRRYRNEFACNCIHAISDMDRKEPMLDSGSSHGKAASETIVNHLRPFVLPSTGPSTWLVDQLDLRSREIQFESGLPPTE
jgi:hypothetical protein